uniref:RING-type domain-containing protein n=1 Tax=Glossina austeni TaxID=7395 RepID=A0A1A9VAJ9_GLOAU
MIKITTEDAGCPKDIKAKAKMADERANLIRSNSCHAYAAESIIDLTQCRTPESLRHRLAEGEERGDHRRNNYEDEDVIIVSSHSNEVIDLTTPPNLARSQFSSRVVCPDQSSSEHNIPGASNEYSLLSTVLPTTPDARTPFMCPLCMESTMQREPMSTRCGHVFCQSCIRQAIKFSRNCPICKAKVQLTDLWRIYP